MNKVLAQRGPWTIESFTVSDTESAQLINKLKTGRGVPGGSYIRLLRDNKIIMSNTPDEINDFTEFVQNATGNVLIAGLGLGLVVDTLLHKDDIKNITIIEISKDLIELMHNKYEGNERVSIIHADIFKWNPTGTWDWGWYDIWDDINPENISEMNIISKRYKKYVKNQWFWCIDECKHQKEIDNDHYV